MKIRTKNRCAVCNVVISKKYNYCYKCGLSEQDKKVGEEE
tara:strand:+ start:251 stop:370 length:120 start_codon:yes stop_codon:yes gene_type:complete